MKRLSQIIAIFLLSAFYIFAEMPEQNEIQSYELANLMTKITEVTKPIITDDWIIFTAKSDSRFTGIVFDFENYNTIHSYQIHNVRDIENNITSSIMFHVQKRPADLTEIKYRLIIDGLWTYDPYNPDIYYDSTSGITLSRVNIGSTLPIVTNTNAQSGTKFIYNGKPGEKVRLGGSFTNWDSWIYEMEETKPGFYELDLPLPKGKYYYNYYIGMTAITDKTNPNKAYTEDGRKASVITIEN
ncbi:MAG: glycogen-binding domain-containing protein [Treponema sp.]|nr:glycogen-binding domain-containing protein [Treponema sp.]